MALKRKKKALYEVINQGVLEQQYGKQRRREDATGNGSVSVEKVGKWPRKPRILQLNGNRVEMSIPFQLAIALILGILLLVLVAFRLGQISRKPANSAEEASKAEIKSIKPADTAIVTDTVAKSKVVADKKEEEPAAKENGDNRIVIATHETGLQLNPVRSYFDDNGIKTEILKIGRIYYLVTRDKYYNPNKRGTDGYYALAKIKKAGANYKQPEGYASFGEKPFQDAYGRKFDD
ncbi:MAG: hypothetical protein ACYSSI_09920 [Planctomycetota bacterium]|jgi:hypothetical protein